MPPSLVPLALVVIGTTPLMRFRVVALADRAITAVVLPALLLRQLLVQLVWQLVLMAAAAVVEQFVKRLETSLAASVRLASASSPSSFRHRERI